MFAVLPFGNRTVILTLTGAQLEHGVPERLLAVLQPGDRAPGRFPQISGLKVHVPLQRHDAGRRRHVEDAERHRWAG